MLSWFVNYKDGTQHIYDSKDFNISHIDAKLLDTIILQHPESKVPALVIHFDDGRKKPIYVVRNELSGIHPFNTRCHMIGWQMKVGKENIQSISYVFETIGRQVEIEQDGKKVLISDDLLWVENAGKFDRTRNSWFKAPSEKQLQIIGSKVHD